jgi:hypothetical protein
VTNTWNSGAETSPAVAGGSLFANPAAHRYNLSVAMSVRNLLNHNNPGPIIGNIMSPLFGQANQVAGALNGDGFSENASNRRLELQLRFTFCYQGLAAIGTRSDPAAPLPVPCTTM